MHRDGGDLQRGHGVQGCDLLLGGLAGATASCRTMENHLKRILPATIFFLISRSLCSLEGLRQTQGSRNVGQETRRAVAIMQGQGVADPSGGHAPADKRSRLEGSPSSVGGKAPRPKARRKRRGKRKSKAERLANRALKQKQLEEAAVPTGQLAPSIDASANTNEAGSQNPFSSPPPQQYTDFVKANDIQMLQKLLAVASLTAAAQVVHALAQGDKLKLATHAMRQLWQRFTGSTTASVTAENAAAAAQFRAAFSSLSLALQQAELHVAAAAVGSGIPGHSVLPILLDLLGDPAAPIKTNVAKTKSEHERLKQAKLILMNPRSGPVRSAHLSCCSILRRFDFVMC